MKKVLNLVVNIIAWGYLITLLIRSYSEERYEIAYFDARMRNNFNLANVLLLISAEQEKRDNKRDNRFEW
jgi:hypothetical protein